MYIYLASSSVYKAQYLGKIGFTTEPYGRLNTYLTGCPPGLLPSYDITYDIIWKTLATSVDELDDMEDEVHNYFRKYRMMRERPGDSEWFNFKTKEEYDKVKLFVESRKWCKEIVDISTILPPKRVSTYMRKHYCKNLDYIKNRSSRNEVLNTLQEPVINSIKLFIADKGDQAGYVIAPCGSGKTIMTSKGIREGVKKCIICCPSNPIQNQWISTLINEEVFTESQIYIMGTAGTTYTPAIRSFFKADKFCIITTYMSSHLLVDMITTNVIDLLILDEAHHMSGIVAENETGEGRTRRLMLKAADVGIKRMSLTYTPRFIIDTDCTSATKYLSMDNHSIFGGKINELKIRDLIQKGVLPDYRLWTLRDEAKKGAGIIGKAECIFEAWKATEIVRGEEKHILHHLIVFAATTPEAKELEQFFKANTTDTLVMRVEQGDKLQEPIANFTKAPRAILVNCFVLNEGVDIPIANAVAITYPKQSRGQITQMVLRAGRWYENKPLFHILIPTLGDEDLSGFEEVLSAIASCDENIRDEILLHSRQASDKQSNPPPSDEISGTRPECIMIDETEANEEDIKKCFTNIRKNIFPARESKRIQELCIEKQIDTSVEYAKLRLEIPELPEDPRAKGMNWFNYLHPTSKEHMHPQEFVKDILDKNNLRVSYKYDEWRNQQSPDIIKQLPSVQHITDGFFGADYTIFDALRERFGKKVQVRGR